MVSYPWFYWLITVLNDFTCFCFPCNLILLGWDRLEKSKWRNEACLCCWSSHWAPGFQLQPFPAKWCAGLLREELWLEQHILPLGFLLQGSPRSHVLGTSAGTIFCSLSSFSLELQPCSLSASLPKLCSSCAGVHVEPLPLWHSWSLSSASQGLPRQLGLSWGDRDWQLEAALQLCEHAWEFICKLLVSKELQFYCLLGVSVTKGWHAGLVSDRPSHAEGCLPLLGSTKQSPVLPQRLQQGTSHTALKCFKEGVNPAPCGW